MSEETTEPLIAGPIANSPTDRPRSASYFPLILFACLFLVTIHWIFTPPHVVETGMPVREDDLVRWSDLDLSQVQQQQQQQQRQQQDEEYRVVDDQARVHVWIVKEEDHQIKVFVVTSSSDANSIAFDVPAPARFQGETGKTTVSRYVGAVFNLQPEELDFIQHVVAGPGHGSNGESLGDVSTFVTMVPKPNHLRGTQEAWKSTGKFVPIQEIFDKKEDGKTVRLGWSINQDLEPVREFLYPFVVTALGADEGARQCGVSDPSKHESPQPFPRARSN